MDDDTRRAIALFRFGVLGPLVSARLEHGDRRAHFEAAARRDYVTPDGRIMRISARTIEAWYYAYRKHGLSGLGPASRGDCGASRSMSAEVSDLVVRAKQEKPRRSIRRIIRMLERAGRVRPGELSRSSVHRLLAGRGISQRPTRAEDADGQVAGSRVERRSYIAEHVGDLWVGDALHVRRPVAFPDGYVGKAYMLSQIDSASRYVPHSYFAPHEEDSDQEHGLRQAILKYGVPRAYYVDRGPAYVAGSLVAICAELGCRLLHAGRKDAELRDLLRYRRKLVESRSAERNRLQKLLETANIKLASVASDVFGVSGMAMLKALVRGDATPAEMAQLAKKRLRQKLGELELALEGRVEEHHRFVLEIQLSRLEEVDKHVAKLDERIDSKLAPYREHHARLTQIPGVDRVLAAVMIAELGTDMTVFKSAGHLAAWAGVCPGNNESAGKKKKGTARKGNVHLMTALVEAAHGASRKKDSYFKDKFFRLKARRGYLRAAVAIAHKILKAVYVMLSTGADYRDLGAAYLDAVDSRRVTGNLVRRLERLGFDVTIAPRLAPGLPAPLEPAG